MLLPATSVTLWTVVHTLDHENGVMRTPFCVYLIHCFVYDAHMATVWVECWKCDECGHRWIKGEVWPTHCASSKCRKRSWNKNGGVSELANERPPNGRAGGIAIERPKSGSAGSSPAPATKPIELRDPPKMNDAMAQFIARVGLSPHAACDPEFVDETPKCPKVGHNEADGESYRCKLPKGHKGNCQPGERV